MLAERGEMDLVRTISETQCPHTREHGRQGCVLREPHAAEGLNRPIEDPLHRDGSRNLDRLNLGVRPAHTDRIHEPRSLKGEQAQLLDLDARPRDPLPNNALLCQGTTERDARLNTLAHQLQSPLGDPNHAHAVVNPPGPQPRLGDKEAVTLSGNKVTHGHTDIRESHLCVATVIVIVVAEDLHGTHNLHTGRIPRYENHGLLAVTLR